MQYYNACLFLPLSPLSLAIATTLSTSTRTFSAPSKKSPPSNADWTRKRPLIDSVSNPGAGNIQSMLRASRSCLVFEFDGFKGHTRTLEQLISRCGFWSHKKIFALRAQSHYLCPRFSKILATPLNLMNNGSLQNLKSFQ